MCHCDSRFQVHAKKIVGMTKKQAVTHPVSKFAEVWPDLVPVVDVHSAVHAYREKGVSAVPAYSMLLDVDDATSPESHTETGEVTPGPLSFVTVMRYDACATPRRADSMSPCRNLASACAWGVVMSAHDFPDCSGHNATACGVVRCEEAKRVVVATGW
jgi:hypothetical protein